MTTDFSKKMMLGFIRKYKKRVIFVGVALVFTLLVGVGVSLQKKTRSGKEFQPESPPKTVELRLQSKKADAGETTDVPQSASFSLKPLPDELLQQLTSLENFNEDVVAAKYSGLRVLWPGYYFTLQSIEGSKATLVLDVAEDGFGVVIESDVDTATYPQLGDLESGKKLWIGGEILAVDRSGTGTIYLKTEHLNFGDAPTPPANRQPAK